MIANTLFISTSEEETAEFARDLALLLRAGDVLFLEGDLGMGKSVFARALIRELSAAPDLEVPSPTFTLVQTYDTIKGPLWHFDLYRIKAPEDVYELGWEDALAEGIVLVEWPSRLNSALAPRNRLELGFSTADKEGTRHLTFTPHGQWKDRL
ncbi:MAG: tRNA ((37)-N6)-threonylcarbamoyltransferase complex ATPase subunit type 1 TsaE [Micavibrio sp.]|nr:tRNA ((37)-N6)-threonylcarbamoyltransferase complex ATPase subunit type 1 TsaE [Micavibrio sp.]